MKASKWIIVLGALLFAAYVVYGTVARAQVTCEVCLTFEGREVCRLGSAPTRDEAIAAGRESACGGNARGMSESIACRNREPDRVTCQ